MGSRVGALDFGALVDGSGLEEKVELWCPILDVEDGY